MAVGLVAFSVDRTRRKRRVTYRAAFSGNYATGGDTLNFTTATNPGLIPGVGVPNIAPEFIEIVGQPGGNAAEGVIGTTPANCKIKLFSSANNELAGGAYNAATIADANVVITAQFAI